MSKVAQKQEQHREEIIRTALGLMKQREFADISVQDICNAAHISIGTFYHYFEKKSDLLVGLLGIVDNYLEESVFPRLKEEDELENLRILTQGFCTHVVSNGLERSRLISAIEPYSRDVHGNLRPINRTVQDIMARGQKKGQIRRDKTPELLCDYYLIALRGVIVDWTRRGGSYDLPPRAADYMDLFLDALASRP